MQAQRSAQLQVLVVPGNPGNANFYVPFMQASTLCGAVCDAVCACLSIKAPAMPHQPTRL